MESFLPVDRRNHDAHASILPLLSYSKENARLFLGIENYNKVLSQNEQLNFFLFNIQSCQL